VRSHPEDAPPFFERGPLLLLSSGGEGCRGGRKEKRFFDIPPFCKGDISLFSRSRILGEQEEVYVR